MTLSRPLRSLRSRVTVLAVGVVVAVLGVTVIAASTLARRQLLDNLDGTLEGRADRLEAAVLAGEPVGVTTDEDRLVQLVGGDNAVLDATPGLETSSLASTAKPGARTLSDVPLDDDTYRVVQRSLADGRVLVVGQNTDDLADSVRAFTLTLAALAPVVAVALGAVVWVVAGRTLRPVDSAMERQRRFVADASHELRTPLTRLKAVVQVDGSAADTTVLETHVHDLENVMDGLLFLAQRDDPSGEAELAPVDLDAIVDREVVRARSTATVDIDMRGVRAAVVTGSERHLERLIRNLLDNASRHARTLVRVSLNEGARGVVLTVEDDGHGIAVADREVVFNRFTRLDEARSRDAGGAGLGLAIVREIATMHDASVTAGESRLGGASFSVVFGLAS